MDITDPPQDTIHYLLKLRQHVLVTSTMIGQKLPITTLYMETAQLIKEAQTKPGKQSQPSSITPPLVHQSSAQEMMNMDSTTATPGVQMIMFHCQTLDYLPMYIPENCLTHPKHGPSYTSSKNMRRPLKDTYTKLAQVI